MQKRINESVRYDSLGTGEFVYLTAGKPGFENPGFVQPLFCSEEMFPLNKKKRNLSVFLTFLILTILLSPRAFAEDGVPAQGAEVQVSTSSYENSDYLSDIDEEYSTNPGIMDPQSSFTESDIDPSNPMASDETEERRIKYQTEANPLTDLSDEAIVDKAKKIPLGLPSGFSGKSGVTPQSLALPDGSGTMQGMGESFAPNLNTGTGTFSVPISLPPGRRGLQPQFGLSYSAGSGNGPLYRRLPLARPRGQGAS